MATSHVAYKQSFGFDAPPFTYKDFEESEVLLFIGANPSIAHPIMWERVMMNPHKPEILVVDPRRTETALAATAHYPILPKSDLTLLYGLAHVLIREGWIDRPFVDAHTEGFDAFADHVRTYDPASVGDATGIGAAAVEELAARLKPGRRVSLWWTMGVNQSYEGVRTAQAIINLALMTGNIGKPGTGPTPSPARSTPWARASSATPPPWWAGATSTTRPTAPRSAPSSASRTPASSRSLGSPTTRSSKA
jgi:assimilatory nitrate reductase catalytic subunit